MKLIEKLFGGLSPLNDVKICLFGYGGTMMKRYKCKVCSYIYDPENGEPRTKTPPGTAFEDLPEEWKCPKCGAAKFRFISI